MLGTRTLTIALLALAVSHPSAALEQPADRLGKATQQYGQDRRRLVADNLQLTALEAHEFWPLYEQFEKDMFVLTGKRSAIITKFGENHESMTDAMAKEIMLERLDIEDEISRLIRVYLPRFEKVLTVKNLARYYQIESKIRTAVDAGIEEALPLIK
jgi:hypothetical protein